MANASRKVSLTADRIAKFRCQRGKPYEIWHDSDTPGLGVRVTAAGAKSYIFEYTLHGRSPRVTIGDVRAWMLKKA